ncbi:glycosyltransferase [Xylophilus ampelinus]|uniref:Glycosyl transferase family 1 n=1 Tax=Xylophilus ampelinus TaxID=54067 RepID=A0A318SID7_9BURK|nr:glycosyltransferase [Xylophilus ampelinus]MCS4509758.1 glycosyltransferase [Xylophilus ampelinus]PYE78714.1 glycosyl transferase family 1 [Xylophilus ampelinus]
MRAIVLGTQSFIDGGTKVGSQHVAEALAAAGWSVDYLPTLSSPVDLIGRQRHARLTRAWAGTRARAVPVAPGLTEWTVRAPFPAHRLFLRWHWQLQAYGRFLPAELRTARFDACIADVAPNLLLVDHLSARATVCRLNDWPRGFAQDLHPVLVEALETRVGSAAFDEVWAVSEALAGYARGLSARAVVACVPNGVEIALSAPAEPQEATAPRAPRSAVYVGGLTAWLDIDLLCQCARLLPDWTFDIHAPGDPDVAHWPANLRWRGRVARADLPAVLQRHAVGLIPFRDAEGRMQYVERPLKFYEYIAAGLGVASTDLGALRTGMGPLACYGNGAADFADAVVRARDQALSRPRALALSFVREHSWGARANIMRQRLEGLLA